MRWGLVPWWAKDIKVGFSSINARAETVDTAPAFRDAWKKVQRCLVVTDGFYEWKKPEKQPYALAMADKSHMVMAGWWDEWTDKKTGERIKSCTIITCPANALIGTLHDRMPAWAKWLGEEPPTNDELKARLVPFQDDALTMRTPQRNFQSAQSRQIGSGRFDAGVHQFRRCWAVINQH